MTHANHFKTSNDDWTSPTLRAGITEALNEHFKHLSSLVYFPRFICSTIFKLTLDTARQVRKPRCKKTRKVTF